MNNADIILFIPCLIDQFYPHIGIDTERVLGSLGYRVCHPSRLTCCGQPFFNAGYRGHATRIARQMLAHMPAEGLIVCPSGSCVSMVRNHYEDLDLTDDEHRKRDNLVGRLYEFCEFIAKFHPDEKFGELSLSLTCHPSCHGLRELGLIDEPHRTLDHINGVRIIPMAEHETSCCGFGGTFSVFFPDIATAIVNKKAHDITSSGTDAVVAADVSCLMHIGGIFDRRGIKIGLLHIATVLAAGLGLSTLTSLPGVTIPSDHEKTR